MARALSAAELRFTSNLLPLGIANSDALSPSPTIIGQDAAMRALGLGLGLWRTGYNVFVAGLKGAGRFAAVRLLLEKLELEPRPRSVLVYVHNFERPEQPWLLRLPESWAPRFHESLDRLRLFLEEEVPAMLGSEILMRRRQRLISRFERESRRVFADLEGRAESEGFRVLYGDGSDESVKTTDLFPLADGEPMPLGQFLSRREQEGGAPSDQQSVVRRYRRLKDDLDGLVARHRRMRMRYVQRVADAERETVHRALEPLLDELVRDSAAVEPRVADYLRGLEKALLDNLALFRDSEDDGDSEGSSSGGFVSLVRANVLRARPSNGDGPLARVIEENHPSYRNLFGMIEASGDPPISTFLDVRAGSLLDADGGYLLLNAMDVMSEPRVWAALKRTLRTGELEIVPRDDVPGVAVGLKPMPIPVDLKVVLVGEPETYSLMRAVDPDFRKIFKIKAEFDDSMPRDEAGTVAFLCVLKRVIDADGLPSFERGALELLLEEGVRMAGSRARLTTHISDLADTMREAAWIAGRRRAAFVGRTDVQDALQQRKARHGLTERRLLEQIRDGKILLQVVGREVGRINGLGYYQLEDAEFGLPLRISATCGVGASGFVNIDRESNLSGDIHDKGFLILSGFLSARFAQDQPLSLSARIAFEQSYGVVDGDSASLAELCALLSSLSDHPLRQDLAVTGSLDQNGRVQPIGGATEKVVGFFNVCRSMGLTGNQGVILPESNVTDLHLPEDVVAAVQAGRFHLYAVTVYDQALALLTGRPADETDAAAGDRLRRYAEVVRAFSRGSDR